MIAFYYTSCSIMMNVERLSVFSCVIKYTFSYGLYSTILFLFLLLYSIVPFYFEKVCIITVLLARHDHSYRNNLRRLPCIFYLEFSS